VLREFRLISQVEGITVLCRKGLRLLFSRSPFCRDEVRNGKQLPPYSCAELHNAFQ
jgi:hypothetical protein